MERITSKETKEKIYKRLEKESHKPNVELRKELFLEIYEKLLAFEDFMEELGLDTVEELRKGYNDNFGFTQALITENQALKDRWNKLYKDIAKFYNDVSNDKRPRCVNDYIFAACEDILYKMRELEKE